MKNFKTAALMVLVLASCTAATDLSSTGQDVLHLGNRQTVVLASGENDDVILDDEMQTMGVIDLVPDASGSFVTGIDTLGVSDAHSLWLRNASSTNPIVFNDMDSSGAYYAGQIYTGTSTAFVLLPQRTVLISYMSGGSPNAWILSRVGSYQPTIAVTSRAAATVYQPSAMNVVEVSYPVSITTTSTLVLGSGGRWDLLIGDSNPPTIVADTALDSIGGGIVNSHTVARTLKAKVPAGWYVELIATATPGLVAPTFTLPGSGQTETTN